MLFVCNLVQMHVRYPSRIFCKGKLFKLNIHDGMAVGSRTVWYRAAKHTTSRPLATADTQAQLLCFISFQHTTRTARRSASNRIRGVSGKGPKFYLSCNFVGDCTIWIQWRPIITSFKCKLWYCVLATTNNLLAIILYMKWYVMKFAGFFRPYYISPLHFCFTKLEYNHAHSLNTTDRQS